jgi:hypothetical protein
MIAIAGNNEPVSITDRTEMIAEATSASTVFDIGKLYVLKIYKVLHYV